MLTASSELRNSIEGTKIVRSDGIQPSLILPERDFYSYTILETAMIDSAITALKCHYTWLSTSEHSDLIVNIRGNYPYLLTKVNGIWVMSSKAILDDLHPDLILKYFKKILAS